jgi:transcription elongation factor GreA
MQKAPMTAEGFTQLEEELKRLKTEERPAIRQALEEARAHGDIAENAEYHAAKERQAFVESRVAELEDTISRAQVIEPSTLSGTTVKFGATVTLIDEDIDAEVKFQIVGENEGDIKKHRLSITSPLARALIGKEVGDEVEVATPGGHKVFELTKIKYV